MFERLIRFQAGRAPNDPAIVLPGESWSYAQVAQLTARFAAHLSDNVKAGERVLLDLPHLGIHWLATLAVEALGGVTIALPGVTASPQALAYAGADHLLTPRPVDFTTEAKVTVIDQAWLNAAQSVSREVPSRQRRPQDPVRIVVTSGTTGANRKILLTREMLDRRVSHAVLSQVFAKAKPRVASEIGPGSIAGVMMGLAAWAIGGAICQRDPKASWAETVDRLGLDAVVLAPAHLQMVLAGLPADHSPSSTLTLFVAGGSLSRPLMQATRERLTANIVVGYGATETGGVAQGHADLLEGFEDAAGFIQPWVEVEVVDADGKPLPPGETGEIRIRGEEVVVGYLDDILEPGRAAFRDGWFYPRDLGLVTADGVLKVLGRLDDLLHLGGEKLLPARLESWALGVEGVADAAAFSRPDEMGIEAPWLAYVRKGDLDVAALQQRMDANLRRPVRLLEVDAIPRNALGKIMRRELRGMAAAS